MQTLRGRVCVFSGATAGDGVAVVKALCRGGMTVIMMTHNVDRAQSLIQEINGAGYPGKCDAMAGGKGRPAEENPEIYRMIEEKYGSVDVIISNTGGFGKAASIEDTTDDDFNFELNHLVGGSFRTMRAALPFLRRSKAPRVILMTTVEGVNGGVHQSFANSVAKGGVHALAVNAAARLAADGITVNCVAKGGIPRVDGLRPGDADPMDFLPRTPMGRIGTPEDLGEVICFLASEESSFITGQTVTLDGGYRLRD